MSTSTGNQQDAFFEKRLITTEQELGDVYDEEKIKANEADWNVPDLSQLPYLQHIKLWSTTWPNLRFLANFMEVSTVPKRWPELRKRENEDERKARWAKTNVARLQYHHDHDGRPVEEQRFTDPVALKEGLQQEEKDDPAVSMVIYAVEDLSRDVIDALGHALDVDPSFFGAHIADYAWYNTRDRFRTSFDLDIDNLQRNWLSLRYVSARYFRNRAEFKAAKKEVEGYNVYRRPDEDLQNKSVWDEEGAVIALKRSRLGLWLKPKSRPNGHATVIVLLDPTMTHGFPLWRDSGTFTTSLSVNSNNRHQIPVRDQSQSTFEEFVFWAKQRAILLDTDGNGLPDQPLQNLPLEIIIRILCARWQVIMDYATTRLNQIDWEITFPKQFAKNKDDEDSALNRLHFWRRVVPLYRSMLDSAINRIFDSPCVERWLNSADPVLSQTPATRNPQFAHFRIPAFKTDMKRLLQQLDEHQARINSVSSVVQAQLAIMDSRRGLTESRNVGRLTWLATFFIPLSLVASMFSMQPDITTSRETFGWFFAASLPLAIILLGVTFLTTMPSVQEWGRARKKAVRLGWRKLTGWKKDER